MAWGKPSAEPPAWLAMCAANDGRLTSIIVPRSRAFDEETQIALAKALEENERVLEVYASGHAVSVKAARAFAVMLAVNVTLKSICLGDENFGGMVEVEGDGRATSALQETLRGCAHAAALETMDLERKGVTNDDGEAIGKVLSQSATMREVRLGRNEGLGAEGYSKAFAGASESVSLEILDLTDNVLDDASARALGALLSSSCPIKRLGLTRCEIGTEGLRALGDGLTSRANVERLELSGVKLGTGGAAALFGARTTTTNVLEIDLTQCGIEDEADVRALSGFLGASPKLLGVNLRGNAFGDAGASSLAVGAFASRAPESLDLGSCKLTAGAMDALSNAIKSSKTLSLFDNALGDEGVANIFAQSSGSSLEVLDLGAVGLSVDGLRAVVVALRNPDAFERLHTLIVGGNPGCQADDWERVVSDLRSNRPNLDVAWRAADGNSDDANRLKRDDAGRVIAIE